MYKLALLILLSLVFAKPVLSDNKLPKYCERIVLDKIKIERKSGRSGNYIITDGKGEILNFSGLQAAQYAFRKIKDHQLELYCHALRDQRQVPFFLTTHATPPRPSRQSLDLCSSFSPPYQIEERRRLLRRHYVITSQTSKNDVTYGEFHTSDLAYRAAEILEKFDFDHICQQRESRSSGFQWFAKAE